MCYGDLPLTKHQRVHAVDPAAERQGGSTRAHLGDKMPSATINSPFKLLVKKLGGRSLRGTSERKAESLHR